MFKEGANEWKEKQVKESKYWHDIAADDVDILKAKESWRRNRRAFPFLRKDTAELIHHVWFSISYLDLAIDKNDLPFYIISF